MRFYLFLMCVCLCFGFVRPAFSGMAVVELYTAQGCGYAEAAEALFADLLERPAEDLVFLSCHVTSFDSADYKDPFSNAWCDQRHKAYRPVAGVLGASSIPQVVVNGRFADQASNTPLVESAVAMVRSLDEVMAAQLSARAGFLDLSLPKMRLEQDAEVWLFSYKKQHIEKVSNGMFQAPTRLLFVHPVMDVRKLFLWDGRYVSMEIPLKGMEGADGYAVLVQNERDLRIIAAGKWER